MACVPRPRISNEAHELHNIYLILEKISAELITRKEEVFNQGDKILISKSILFQSLANALKKSAMDNNMILHCYGNLQKCTVLVNASKYLWDELYNVSNKSNNRGDK